MARKSKKETVKKPDTKKVAKKVRTSVKKMGKNKSALSPDAIKALKETGRVSLSGKQNFITKEIPKHFRYVYNPRNVNLFISSLRKTVRPNELVDLNILEPSKKKREKAIVGDLRNAAERGVVLVFKRIEDIKTANLPVVDSTPPIEKMKKGNEVAPADGIKKVLNNENPFIEQLKEEEAKEEREIEKVTKSAKK